MLRQLFANMGPVVKNILILNVLMFLVAMVMGQGQNGNLLLNKYLGLYIFNSPNFQPYQLVTHMFMHGNFMHIFFNMFALVMFGVPLERVWGSKRFLIFYFVSGFGAALIQQGASYYHLHQLMESVGDQYVDWDYLREASGLSMATQMDEINVLFNKTINEFNVSVDVATKVFYQYKIPVVGASGAVFGILLGFGMLFPNTELIMLFLPVPIKAKYFVIIYGLIELFSGISNRPGDNIAHFAHVGGMIFGFFLIKYWQKTDRQNFY